ncbi:MAG: methyltransferase [Planctomycetota bacterium]
MRHLERSAAELLKMDLRIGGGDWTPTPHGKFMAEVLARNNLVEGKEVLELGGGTGNHTIIMVRQGAQRIVTTEILPERLETTRRNVERNCPDARNVEYRVADWLRTPGAFDLVVTNPPFARSGKRNRRYFIDSLILDAHRRLRPDGLIVFVQSSMADLPKTRAWLEENGYAHEVLGRTEGPFRDSYFEDETFMEEVHRAPDGFKIRDGVYTETLYVVKARLERWEAPGSAHLPS